MRLITSIVAISICLFVLDATVLYAAHGLKCVQAEVRRTQPALWSCLNSHVYRNGRERATCITGICAIHDYKVRLCPRRHGSERTLSAPPKAAGLGSYC